VTFVCSPTFAYRGAVTGWQDERIARRCRVGLAVLALLVPASPASAARSAKLVGRLSGVPAKTRAVVTAIDPNRATPVASAVVGRKGRFKLPARPAVTMLFGAVEGEQSLFAAAARPFASGIPAPVVSVDWSMTGTLNGRSFPPASYVQGGLVRYGDRRCQLTVADSDPAAAPISSARWRGSRPRPSIPRPGGGGGGPERARERLREQGQHGDQLDRDVHAGGLKRIGRGYSSTRPSRSAFAITETELRLIAALASIGSRRSPVQG
jgi:hypothetical protein